MWTLTPSERLRFWYDFRQKLNTATKIEAIQSTTSLWSFAPFVKHYLHHSDLTNWPDPWELIYENRYCDLAKCLGMFYTLHLSNHRPYLEIRVYQDILTKEQYNLVWIDKGKYVLNYVFNEVVNKEQIEKNMQLIKIITVDDLNMKKIE